MTARPGPDVATAPPRAAGHGWRAVSIVLVGAFMALLDTTIVNVALPSIRTGLHAPAQSLEWIVAGYALAYGLALVPAGRAGDRFGHKPLFLLGLTIFTLASVACGVASTRPRSSSPGWCRGSGPGSSTRPSPPPSSCPLPGRSARAFGVLGAIIGVSTALGPLLGGLIIAAPAPAMAGAGYSWSTCSSAWSRCRWRPGGCPASPAYPARFRSRRPRPAHRGLLLLLVPLVEGQPDGWPPGRWACSAAAAWPPPAGRLGGPCGPAWPRPAAQARVAEADLVLRRRHLRDASTSAASPASSSPCPSCGRKDSGTAR